MTDVSSLPQALQAALEKRGYETLTPVQESILKDAPADADLLVSAQTGSGKTVAFGLALAPTLMGDSDNLGAANAPIAIAIAPTRELALQVKEELSWLYKEAGAVLTSCVGGMDPRMERRALERGAHIVVGTPGRLRDHLERGALDLSRIKAVVLDEADEMLDMGFREDLEFILDAAPAQRRTLMFSATVPKSIAELAKRYQRDALRLSTISAREQHGDIAYIAHPVVPNERENAIINVLRWHEAEKSIIFCSTREAVKRLTARLGNRGFSIVSLSGELSQEQRSAALAAMKNGTARVCVATDVAARGIDLPNLDLVIHADLPTGKAALLHRSGRTGRAGRKGTCVLMVPFPRRKAAERTLQFAGVNATWTGAPTADDIRAKDKERLFQASVLTAEYEPEELAMARELLEKHDPEKLAAAFVKLHHERLPPPEDVSETNDDYLRGRDAGSRGGRSAEIQGKFEEGVWFRLSLGHKHRADPRWLLPMICRAGHVTKGEVGAIKIFQTETRFEIAGDHAERYAAKLKRDGSGEENVTIELIDARKGKVPPPPREEGGWKKPRRGPGTPDYENLGREDRLDGDKPRRGRPNDRFGDKKPPKAKKRGKFGDDEAAPHHPAYEPLDMKALAGDRPERSERPNREDRPRRDDRPNRDDRPRRDDRPNRDDRKPRDGDDRPPFKGKKPPFAKGPGGKAAGGKPFGDKPTAGKGKPKKAKPSRAARKEARSKTS